jgi:hypothetical protein
MAGAGGIEPTLAVLETDVLPLYDAPVFFLGTSLASDACLDRGENTRSC